MEQPKPRNQSLLWGLVVIGYLGGLALYASTHANITLFLGILVAVISVWLTKIPWWGRLIISLFILVSMMGVYRR